MSLRGGRSPTRQPLDVPTFSKRLLRPPDGVLAMTLEVLGFVPIFTKSGSQRTSAAIFHNALYRFGKIFPIYFSIRELHHRRNCDLNLPLPACWWSAALNTRASRHEKGDRQRGRVIARAATHKGRGSRLRQQCIGNCYND